MFHPNDSIPYSGGSSKFSVSIVSSFLLGIPSSLNYIIAKLHLIIARHHLVFSTCLSFRLIILLLRSSSWRLYMMVHKRFNFFLKCWSRFFSKELKYFFILHSEVKFFLSYLFQVVYLILDNFPSCIGSRWVAWSYHS